MNEIRTGSTHSFINLGFRSDSMVYYMNVYLEGDVFPEGDVSGHSEVVQLQHVGDVLEPLQILLNLEQHK